MSWFDVEVEEHQKATWRVEAKDEDEARELFSQGEGDLIDRDELDFLAEIMNVTEVKGAK